MKAALANPDVVRRLDEFGTQPAAKELLEPARFKKFFQEEADKWRPIITESGTYADSRIRKLISTFCLVRNRVP